MAKVSVALMRSLTCTRKTLSLQKLLDWADLIFRYTLEPEIEQGNRLINLNLQKAHTCCMNHSLLGDKVTSSKFENPVLTAIS